MKTIEERAKDFAKGRRYTLTAYESYIAGADEQKAIDDAKWNKIKSSWEKEAQINHNEEANYQQGFHDAIEKARKWYTSNDKPISWKEYCKQNPIKAGDSYIDEISFINSIENSRDRNEDDDVNTMPKYLCEAFLAYMKLIQLRNAWVEEYGKTDCYYKIASENDGIMCKSCDYFMYGLSFPTKDITDEFMHTFEDLLEVAKPLL